MSEEVELKRCPFCGAEPEDCPQNSERPHPQRKGDWCVYIWCDNCDARGPEKREPDEAIAAWNTRTPSLITEEGVTVAADAVCGAAATKLGVLMTEHHARILARAALEVGL